jgi:hypothetical protein
MASYVLVAEWRSAMTGCEATEIRPPAEMSAAAARAEAAAWGQRLSRDGFSSVVMRVETPDGTLVDWCVIDETDGPVWQTMTI